MRILQLLVACLVALTPQRIRSRMVFACYVDENYATFNTIPATTLGPAYHQRHGSKADLHQLHVHFLPTATRHFLSTISACPVSLNPSRQTLHQLPPRTPVLMCDWCKHQRAAHVPHSGMLPPLASLQRHVTEVSATVGRPLKNVSNSRITFASGTSLCEHGSYLAASSKFSYQGYLPTCLT